MRDWAGLDVSAAIDHAQRRWPTVPLTYVGHSFGGQALGLVPNNNVVTRALLVSALLASTPGIAAKDRPERIVLKGELPSPLNPPVGCVFSTRCPHVIERCRVERPALRPLDGRQVSCHLGEQFLEPGRPDAGVSAPTSVQPH